MLFADSIAAIAAAEITKEPAIVAAVIAEEAESAIAMVAAVIVTIAGQANMRIHLKGGERHDDGEVSMKR